MALANLATTDDLTDLGIDTTDTDLVASLLASVSAAVREAAGVPITRITSTVKMWTEPSRRVELPSRPVHEVTSVTVDGEVVTDWSLRGSSLYRPCPWHRQGDIPAELVVTFEHGWDEVPADVVKLVCTLVAAGLAESDAGIGSTRGISSERIDDYQVSFTRGDDELVDKTELPERTRLALRRRFAAGGAVVVGSVA